MTVRRPIVGVMGASRASEEHLRHARALGRLIATHGWILLTGGRAEGVMEAAASGAKEVAGSLTVGILPDRDSPVAEGVDIPIVTDLGDARNTVNVLSCKAIIACGVEGAGTASEVALAIKAGVPVVLLACPPEAVSLFQRLGRGLVHAVHTPEAAVSVLADRIGIPLHAPWPV
jgi:hypothetical protein